MNVFISYQRADTLFVAHALGYALRLGGHDAFVDTGSVARGDLYREDISNAVSTTNVMLALIGPCFDAQRLHEPNSVVAFEWQRARFHGTAVVPVLVDDGSMPTDEQLPSHLRWFTRRNALTLRRSSFSGDVAACVADIPKLALTPRRVKRVLWVDDRPANNEYERKQLRPAGIVFDNVVSTDEALDQVASETYDLVITDLGRPASSDRSGTAGARFLEDPKVRSGPPVIVYASPQAMRQRDELMKGGALDVISDREQLLAAVLNVLGRSQDPSNDLRR